LAQDALTDCAASSIYSHCLIDWEPSIPKWKLAEPVCQRLLDRSSMALKYVSVSVSDTTPKRINSGGVIVRSKLNKNTHEICMLRTRSPSPKNRKADKHLIYIIILFILASS